MNINPGLPALGVSDFKEIIQENSITKQKALYFDKTLMIKDLIEDKSKFLLFTRPRRFGKTLNMSMLKYFFSSNENIFSDLEIFKYPDILLDYHGKIPAILFSLKDVQGTSYEQMLQNFSLFIKETYRHHKSVLSHDQIEWSHNTSFTETEILNSLKNLSEILYNHYSAPVIILIDEYDTPLNNAYVENHLGKAVKLFRQFFSQTFKDNPYIYKGIITGINRIAKENIFSGLNNFKSYGIDSEHYTKYFGFTQEEIDSLDIANKKKEEIKEWYNGYRFGKTVIYNPWSVLNYLSEDCRPSTYWSNTGGMQMIEKNVHIDQTKDLNTLLSGKPIEVEIDSDLVYTRLENNKNAFFNLLYFAGYLTRDHINPGDLLQANLKIVNKEVTIYLTRLVKDWFSCKNDFSFFVELIEAFTTGDAEEIGEKLQETILQTISFHDATKKNREAFYHGLMLGISLTAKNRYQIKSNRESGTGRYDIAWYPKEIEKDPGIVIELKVNNLSLEESLHQIDTKMYKNDLVSYGCKKILCYGIHYNGKVIKVKSTS